MQKVILTGVSGFIGSHVARHLLSRGYEVISPVRPASLKKEHISRLSQKGLRVVEGSFFEDDVLDKTFRETAGAVVHLAAIRGEQNFSIDDYRRVNVEGTRKLLQKAAQCNVPKFIYCSSVGVYGTIPGDQPADLNTPLKPDNHYHQSKREAELFVQAAHGAGISTCILRPTVTYGTGDNGFIPRLVKLTKAKRFPLSTKPVKIHLLYVEALAALIARLINDGNFTGRAFIVADEKPVFLHEIVNAVYELAYGRSYPVLLRFPKTAFSAGEHLLKWTNRQKLLTSWRLISRDWTYDISATVSEINYEPRDTMSSLLPVIKEYLNE
ncbi:MAG TPA: NAD-dependent epimerase/dehydratase family protein [Caldithrix abyssi]|uniref:NAD-dependent epimerase/dehydratase family protein n=1 Tax=Caldithrix abyssi TaxID=187145 RepID=A0A7V4U2V3_CALAY|nr:NAD-dependent epimerase/dehydratase family protein [Caldithrix abyssi]